MSNDAPPVEILVKVLGDIQVQSVMRGMTARARDLCTDRCMGPNDVLVTKDAHQCFQRCVKLLNDAQGITVKALQAREEPADE